MIGTEHDPKKSSLSASQTRLVEEMQRLNFGCIERLLIHGGEPIFDPPPRLIRDVKLGADNGPRPEMAKEDFALKSQGRTVMPEQVFRVSFH